uniref:Uncharacterized protein n=1 Tax=Astyanax mexicanus TaxID=7994 RepID=A0A3B1ILA5_ASTMX
LPLSCYRSLIHLSICVSVSLCFSLLTFTGKPERKNRSVFFNMATENLNSPVRFSRSLSYGPLLPQGPLKKHSVSTQPLGNFQHEVNLNHSF